VELPVVLSDKMDKQARQIDEALPGAEVRVGEGIKLVLNENAVRFDTNKSSLTADAKANLDKPCFADILILISPFWIQIRVLQIIT
jgi:outer membrane protein OmpA-like peptidoglycan-associated protein